MRDVSTRSPKEILLLFKEAAPSGRFPVIAYLELEAERCSLLARRVTLFGRELTCE